MFRDMGKKLADRRSALAVVGEFPGTHQCLADVVELGRLNFHFERLPILLFKQRLGVECIDLGRTTIHIEIDNPFGLGRKVGKARGAGEGGVNVRAIGREEAIAAEEAGEGDGAERGKRAWRRLD